MSTGIIVILIGGVGLLGGLINCFVTGEFVFPSRDPLTRNWRPGWIGNLVAGGFAALAVWAMNSQTQGLNVEDLIRQLASSFLVGMGGGNILTQYARSQTTQTTKTSLEEKVLLEKNKGTLLSKAYWDQWLQAELQAHPDKAEELTQQHQDEISKLSSSW